MPDRPSAPIECLGRIKSLRGLGIYWAAPVDHAGLLDG